MKTNIEYKTASEGYPVAFKRLYKKTVVVVCDVNTYAYAEEIIDSLKRVALCVSVLKFEDTELVPTQDKCLELERASAGADYILAVGSGTLNDMAKDVSTRLKIACGVLATAPSMDGYASKGAALMIDGKKVTNTVHMPSDILIDPYIISAAPKNMIAAGLGDILGKYTCLTDWRLSNILYDEKIDKTAYKMMNTALNACVDNYEELTKYTPNSIAKLMDALITAGLAMAKCGNSRPASGSEHHLSHFLEMDFVARGERVPLHGIKVGIGALISIELYNYLADNKIKFAGNNKVFNLVKALPKACDVANMLTRMGSPIKMSEIGVRREVMEAMIEKAYMVRDRFTILTLIHNLGLTEKIKPIIMDKYF